MELTPDIELAGVLLIFPDGTRRLYWQPSCLRCAWQDEPHRNKESAQIAAGLHLKTGNCFYKPGGGDEVLD